MNRINLLRAVDDGRSVGTFLFHLDNKITVTEWHDLQSGEVYHRRVRREKG